MRVMATFVLVHGGWSGAHGWLGPPNVSLRTHVDDVVNQILFEDLDRIVLVGYSRAVVIGALDHIGDRLNELVYLGTFVPRDGDTVSALSGRDRPDRLTIGSEGSCWRRRGRGPTTIRRKRVGKPNDGYHIQRGASPNRSGFDRLWRGGPSA